MRRDTARIHGSRTMVAGAPQQVLASVGALVSAATAAPAAQVMLETLQLDGDVEEGTGVGVVARFLLWAPDEAGLDELAAGLRAPSRPSGRRACRSPASPPTPRVRAAVAAAHRAAGRQYVEPPMPLPFATDFGDITPARAGGARGHRPAGRLGVPHAGGRRAVRIRRRRAGGPGCRHGAGPRGRATDGTGLSSPGERTSGERRLEPHDPGCRGSDRRRWRRLTLACPVRVGWLVCVRPARPCSRSGRPATRRLPRTSASRPSMPPLRRGMPPVHALLLSAHAAPGRQSPRPVRPPGHGHVRYPRRARPTTSVQARTSTRVPTGAGIAEPEAAELALWAVARGRVVARRGPAGSACCTSGGGQA